MELTNNGQIDNGQLDRTLSGATTLGQSGPGSNGNEGVLRIPQISKAGSSPSYGLISYPGHLLVGVLPLCRDAVDVLYSPSWLVGFHGISIFVGYFMPNSFLYK